MYGQLVRSNLQRTNSSSLLDPFMKYNLILLPLLVLLVSCKSNTNLEPQYSNTDANWEGQETYQVLVSARFFNPQLRQYYETEMTRGLQAKQVSAVASFTIFPNLNAINAKSIQDAMQSNPNVAILFTEANAVNRAQQSSDVEASSIFSKLRGGKTIDWNTQISAILQSSLFVSGQETAVWWDSTKLLTDESDARNAIKKLVQLEIKEMEKSGVIERLK